MHFSTHLEFAICPVHPSFLASYRLGSDGENQDLRVRCSVRREGCWGAGSPPPFLLPFPPLLGQGKPAPLSGLLLPFVCRPGLAVPGPQRELPGELPAAVPGEPGSPAQVLRQVSVRSAVSRRCRAPEPRPKSPVTRRHRAVAPRGLAWRCVLRTRQRWPEGQWSLPVTALARCAGSGRAPGSGLVPSRPLSNPPPRPQS